jgi:myosin-light-chain kinase
MGDNDLQTMSNVTSGLYDFDDEAFDVISDEAKNFIGKLLLRNPS